MTRFALTRATAILASGALLAGGASADCVRLVAQNDPTQPNNFTLDFGQFGGTRTANITSTNLVLEICDGATARFADYYQEAEPLILPDGTSTGDLTILVNPSRPLSYDAVNGIFTTDDDYQIHFTGDLSAYGIQSPFGFQHQSSLGEVNYVTATTGTIMMSWSGNSALPNPFDPGGPLIPFAYQCAVNASFVTSDGCGPNGGCSGDLDGSCSVGLEDLTIQLANFGTNGARVRPDDGDLNGDLVVDLSDLSGLLSQFGSDCN
jgi:hypothetical protein